MIGDTTVDIQTGFNAGMKTILVLTGEAGKDKKYDIKADIVAEDLLDAVHRIISIWGICMKDYKKRIEKYIELEKRILDSLVKEEINEVLPSNG